MSANLREILVAGVNISAETVAQARKINVVKGTGIKETERVNIVEMAGKSAKRESITVSETEACLIHLSAITDPSADYEP